MKLSMAWIFEQIDVQKPSVSIEQLVDACIKTTAEIEGFYPLSLELSSYTLATIEIITPTTVIAFSPEWNQSYQLPPRADATSGAWYLIKNDSTWATLKTFGHSKDGLLPELYTAELAPTTAGQRPQAGSWKIPFETADYIIEVDNKSINNRPDLWSHRGFAREIAAIFNLPLKPLKRLLADLVTHDYADQSKASPDNPFIIDNQASATCKRFAGLYIKQVSITPSLLWMAHRLCRVESKPINAIVDCTNYVMFDIGQPLHAFDAASITTKRIVPRFARTHEKLTLLDDIQLTLTPEDLVISDGAAPLSLAGIKGGAASGISPTTTALFVEAANFDASTIRKSAARHKIRTESSTRFEKTLDPHQIVIGLKRFIKLLDNAGIACTPSDISICGPDASAPSIIVTHDFIQQCLGVKIEPDFVKATLEKLEFMVIDMQGTYTIKVPTFRATKDISIKEDIVEEIGRFFGYGSILPTLPPVQMKPSNLEPIMRVRTIKQCMAQSMLMRELSTYAFFDEDFLRHLDWNPAHTASVQNPVSENWRRLVTTLVPNLCKAIHQNAPDHEQLRFFEWGRTWTSTSTAVDEKKTLTAIIFDKKGVDFYSAKELMQRLFDALSLPVTWNKSTTSDYPWYLPYQTATIAHHEIVIGTVGKIDPLFFQKVAEGDACILELDGDFLLNYSPELKNYVPIPKYPEVHRDISILIASSVSVDAVKKVISTADAHIIDTTLIDFFENPAWNNQRALTFRLTIQNSHKTLTKEEVDSVIELVTTRLHSHGATTR